MIYTKLLQTLDNMKKLILSSFLISGAAIGSGVLALPIIAAGPGLVNTLIFITITFVISYCIAIISIDVYSRYDDHNVNASTVAFTFFGRNGYWFSNICNLFGMGACVAAYINVGGDLFNKILLPLIGISSSTQLGVAIFCFLFLPTFIVGLGLISRLNFIIFFIKFACLGLVIILGMKFIDYKIFEVIPSAYKYLGAGATTMFCIWSMHMVLPLVLKITDWNTKKAKRAVQIGMLLPMFVYVGWLFLIFSLASRNDFLQIHTVSDLLQFTILKPSVPAIISSIINVFASITVLTAFFSIGFSLVAFIIDALKWHNTAKSRLYATFLGFIIPILIAVSFPKAFITIYQNANVFIIAAALIPVAAAYSYNKRYKLTTTTHSILITLGILIIIAQILNDFEFLPIFT